MNGNGYDALNEDKRIERRIDEVESHVPRIGALEHDIILQNAALAGISRDVTAVNTNVNSLRLEMYRREDVFREALERIEKKLGTR